MAFEELNIYMKDIFINLDKTDTIRINVQLTPNKMMYSVANFILLGLVARLRFFLCTNHKNSVSMA